MHSTRKLTIHELTIIGIMTAIICILGPISIPLGVVPISLTSFAIYLAVYILGYKKGTICYIVYLFMGFIGLPVFSGFSGGVSKIFGPTGGYLIGFIFMAIISGIFIEKFFYQKSLCFLGMILGAIINYIFGTIWLAYEAHMSFSGALMIGVLPFILGDIIKILVALFIGSKLKNIINKI